MSFILRAALVIGTLSYLAAQRDGGVRPAAELKALAERQGPQITALAGALPAQMREAATNVAATEVVRRLAADPVSRDTLSDTDRRLQWRGGESR